MKSWKTSVLGLVAIIAAIGRIAAPAEYDRAQRIADNAMGIAAGLGLIAAKDHDK